MWPPMKRARIVRVGHHSSSCMACVIRLSRARTRAPMPPRLVNPSRVVYHRSRPTCAPSEAGDDASPRLALRVGFYLIRVMRPYRCIFPRAVSRCRGPRRRRRRRHVLRHAHSDPTDRPTDLATAAAVACVLDVTLRVRNAQRRRGRRRGRVCSRLRVVRRRRRRRVSSWTAPSSAWRRSNDTRREYETFACSHTSITGKPR